MHYLSLVYEENFWVIIWCGYSHTMPYGGFAPWDEFLRVVWLSILKPSIPETHLAKLLFI